MKRLFIQKILAFLARNILSQYKPDVIGITGSVGKTSTKEAISLVLAAHFRVRASPKNFNTEIGVPLTIIGVSEIPRSLFGWVRVFFRALSLTLIHNGTYPSILVLEMGADTPGDIAYLTSIAPCKIGVLTAISPVHLEQFETMEKLSEEKKIICRHLSSDGIAILNADDPTIFPPTESFAASIRTFGLNPDANVQANEIKRTLRFKEGSESYGGTRCVINIDDKSMDAIFPLIFRIEHLSCILAALAVGDSYHIPLPQMLEWLTHFQAPPGRSRLLPGVKHTLLIDDSYNSSPRAARGAIDALMEWEIQERAKHIAVLGDMRELGTQSEHEHRELGEYVASKEIDLLVTVGAEAKYIAASAKKAGMNPDNIEEFDNAYSAGKYLQGKIARGDVILIKGSQDVRLEKIAEELMAQPQRAGELLVRQEEYWKR
ncbi:hypothetical protein HY621_03680 [Candidatus Uhrbacteria bacterium]|nr:hypothetical protein [Candidatus Uhrbacteria bacterium]